MGHANPPKTLENKQKTMKKTKEVEQGADFWEVDLDSNFSNFGVRRFTEWLGPLHWIAFPVEILTKRLIHWIPPPFSLKTPFFSLKSASSDPLPKNRLLAVLLFVARKHQGHKNIKGKKDRDGNPKFALVPDWVAQEQETFLWTLRSSPGKTTCRLFPDFLGPRGRRPGRLLFGHGEVRVYRGTGVSHGVRRTTWERSLKNWELQIPCFQGFFWARNTLGLVPASLPHALGYACTFYAPLPLPWFMGFRARETPVACGRFATYQFSGKSRNQALWEPLDDRQITYLICVGLKDLLHD